MIPGFILMTETESTDPNMHKKTNYIPVRLFFHITSKVRHWGFYFTDTQVKQKHLCHQGKAMRFYLINRNLRSVLAIPRLPRYLANFTLTVVTYITVARYAGNPVFTWFPL